MKLNTDAIVITRDDFRKTFEETFSKMMTDFVMQTHDMKMALALSAFVTTAVIELEQSLFKQLEEEQKEENNYGNKDV